MDHAGRIFEERGVSGDGVRILVIASNSHLLFSPRTGFRCFSAFFAAFITHTLAIIMFERYHRELLNFLRRQVPDRDTAADLVQESYARVLSVQSSGQAVLDMRALLYRTARNLVIDQHRRAAVRLHDDLYSIPEDQHPPAPQYLQPEEALAAKQVIRAYVATIEALPPRCREAFVLHVFDDLSHAQIAQKMGISVSMVEKHVVRSMVACKLCERRLRMPAAKVPEAKL